MQPQRSDDSCDLRMAPGQITPIAGVAHTTQQSQQTNRFKQGSRLTLALVAGTFMRRVLEQPRSPLRRILHATIELEPALSSRS